MYPGLKAQQKVSLERHAWCGVGLTWTCRLTYTQTSDTVFLPLTDKRVYLAQVSAGMLALVKLSLSIAEGSLVAETSLSANKQVSRDVAGAPATRPFKQSDYFVSDFDQFVRTCTFAPTHPVLRTLPYFKQDYIAQMSGSSRRKTKKNETKAAREELRRQSEMMGQTCNKYKTKQRALTPGMFTVFCGGCGVCVAFEMMPIFESPVTAFKTFLHRAWTIEDFETLTIYEATEEWNDHI